MLNRFIRVGTLRIVTWDGCVHEFVGSSDPTVTIAIHDPRVPFRLARNAYLYLGEAYMDGTLTVEDGTIHDFLDLCGRNLERCYTLPFHGVLLRVNQLLRRFRQLNPLRRARRNVAHHYDISNEFFDLFLDADRQYSCAYFGQPDDSLEIAQERKKRHIAAKLYLQPGQKVLDVGSGWGGLARYLASVEQVDVTGVTLSEEQLRYAREQSEKQGFGRCTHFHLRDYREVTGRYNRIVSVGMLEHVGFNYYREFFGKIYELLDDDGVALVHSIGHADGPDDTAAWIRKYIFPGGYSPALSEIIPVVEKSGLLVTDIEVLRLHYADTLREWSRRFTHNRGQVAAMYDERFCRMWEFYLAVSEMGFRWLNLMVFQLQLTKRKDALPLTRDYIFEWECRSNRPRYTQEPSG